ncbi:MAG: lipoate--protein ligase [Gammaproteobacteria bacterium SG8_47]|nr:MAG: lipoate--protein ligase [Gammaproteobacteria bacterium SG8_47]
MAGKNQWRVLDTGVRPAAQNMALNRAVLETHAAGEAPHTLRFLQFTPSALIGFHQDVAQELRVDYCRAHDIAIQRRISGGGAIYLDETQLGWELYTSRRFFGTPDMTAIARRVCEAAAAGISRLGVDARYRPRNDIEVDGRKISGTGGVVEADSICYQGTVLIDFDVERMLRVLRIPAEKLSDKAIASARERVVNLTELLGHTPGLGQVKDALRQAFAEAFGLEFSDQGLNAVEAQRYGRALEEMDSDDWVYQPERRPRTDAVAETLYRCQGGTVRVCVVLDEALQRIKQLWIFGDFFLSPSRVVLDLEATLKDSAVANLEHNVRQFFAQRDVDMLLLQPADFIAAIRQAIEVASTAP